MKKLPFSDSSLFKSFQTFPSWNNFRDRNFPPYSEQKSENISNAHVASIPVFHSAWKPAHLYYTNILVLLNSTCISRTHFSAEWISNDSVHAEMCSILHAWPLTYSSFRSCIFPCTCWCCSLPSIFLSENNECWIFTWGWRSACPLRRDFSKLETGSQSRFDIWQQ